MPANARARRGLPPDETYHPQVLQPIQQCHYQDNAEIRAQVFSHNRWVFRHFSQWTGHGRQLSGQRLFGNIIYKQPVINFGEKLVSEEDSAEKQKTEFHSTSSEVLRIKPGPVPNTFRPNALYN